MRGLASVGAVCLAASMLNGAARCQDPIRMYPVSAGSVYEMPSYPNHSFGHNNNPLVGTGYTPNPPVRSTPFGDRMRRCDACCWAHHNNLECSTLKSEAVFIFGSCKAFYGERCLPKPLPVDHHGWWDRYGRY